MASIRQRASTAWRVFRHGLPPHHGLPPAGRKAVVLNPLLSRAGVPQWHTTNYETWATEGFGENSLIYSAIMYKVRSKMSAPLRAYVGDPRAAEELPLDHPLSRLLMRVFGS